jgi:hypothetical protein
MTTDRKLAELLDAATVDVPADRLAPPLAAIRGRVRRRRRTLAVFVAAATAAVVAGGVSAGRWILAEPAPPAPIGPAVTASPTVPLTAVPWVSAMVSRGGGTITVYAGAQRCEELYQPVSRVREEGDRVTIEVSGRTVPATECAAGGNVMAIVVKLRAPLGERTLFDADGQARPTYFERHLPELWSDRRWSVVPGLGWQSDDPTWYESYNGPGGATLALRAEPTELASQLDPVTTVDLGPYEGAITVNTANMYRVWWQVGPVTYSLRILPTEGASMTLTQFKKELAGLKWT